MTTLFALIGCVQSEYAASIAEIITDPSHPPVALLAELVLVVPSIPPKVGEPTSCNGKN